MEICSASRGCDFGTARWPIRARANALASSVVSSSSTRLVISRRSAAASGSPSPHSSSATCDVKSRCRSAAFDHQSRVPPVRGKRPGRRPSRPPSAGKSYRPPGTGTRQSLTAGPAPQGYADSPSLREVAHADMLWAAWVLRPPTDRSNDASPVRRANNDTNRRSICDTTLRAL